MNKFTLFLTTVLMAFMTPAWTIQKGISRQENSNALHHPPSSSQHNFQGWWKRVNKGTNYGFFGMFLPSFTTSLIGDQYIYIDTSTNPVTVSTTWGTPNFPRLTPDALDTGPYAAPIINPPAPNAPPNAYFFQGPDQLVSFFNPPLKNADTPLLSCFASPTLKLKDQNTLISYQYSNSYYAGDWNLGVYKRVKQSPNDTSNFDWNDPVLLFKYYIDLRHLTQSSTNVHAKNRDYVGSKKEMKITEKFLGKGFSKQTPVRKIRVTNTLLYNDLLIPNDRLTTIYTGDSNTNEGIFSFATPGSTVTLEGFSGPLAILNGTYVNGVGVLNAGAVPNPNSHFVDSGPHGSFQDLFDSFPLNFDSSALLALADQNGLIHVPPGATVSVKHQVTSSMEYPAFCAAVQAWFYAVFQVGVHNFSYLYCRPNSCILIDTFADLQSVLLNGNYSIQLDGGRLGQASPNTFYHNNFLFNQYFPGSLNTSLLINSPFPVSVNNPLFNYDVALGNYLVDVQNLVYAIQGTLEEDQPDPVSTFGYLPIVPGQGRAAFVSKVVPAQVIDGVIQPPTLPPGYAPLGDTGVDELNFNFYYFGHVNPALTNGATIGYLYMWDCGIIDPYTISQTGIYSPVSSNSHVPRAHREGLSQMYSEMFKWFNAEPPYNVDECGNVRKPCETIIIDITTCEGGWDVMMAFAEFFGKNRRGYTHYSEFFEDHQAPLIAYNDEKKYPTVNRVARKEQKNIGNLYVSLNKKKYPGSVIEGTRKKPRHVIIMDDIFAYAMGDIFPNLFIGKGKNNHLGHHVYAHVIGCLDGRGSNPTDYPVSFPVNSKTLWQDPSGNPVSPITFNLDYGGTYWTYGNQQISMLLQNKYVRPRPTPGLRGTSGGAALPISMEELPFQDMGYIPNTRPALEGWTNPPPNPNDHTTWRFLYLEQAIRKARELLEKE